VQRLRRPDGLAELALAHAVYRQRQVMTAPIGFDEAGMINR
jgi:hypothetical protein